MDQWTATVPLLMNMKSEEEVKKEGDDEDDIANLLEGCATVDNKRGDDYQEQIGLPDEENMRNWSHHHTTDTVDDPIFRAAMRGCDSVSFVFGLEVTWSLIQQRQQEEEDRKAMEAIEEVGEEEVEAAAMENSDDEDEDSSDDEGETEFDATNADGATAEENGENQADGPHNTSEDEDSVSSNVKEMAEDGNESPREKDTSPTETFDSPKEELDSDIENEPPSQGSTSNLKSPAKDEWQCLACTLFNKKGMRKCDACGVRKPAQSGLKRPIDEVSQ